jgi:hypothetical protein
MGDVRAAADRWVGMLHEKGVPLTNEATFRANFTDFIGRLRGRPTMGGFLQRAGAPVKTVATGDPFGDLFRGLKDGLESPEAVFILQTILGFLFALSTVEDIPMVGSLLSVSLDVVTSAGRMLMKALQKGIPTLLGLIPLPYMSLLGLIFVSLIGMIVWPLLAMVSFSRQDFTAAMDSLLRVIPPPIGETLAEVFLTANGTAAKVGHSVDKFMGQLIGGVDAIVALLGTVETKATEAATKGLAVFQKAIPTVPGSFQLPTAAPPVTEPPAAEPPPPTPAPLPVAEPPRGGQKPLSTKPQKGRKWREQRLYERFSGAGLR